MIKIDKFNISINLVRPNINKYQILIMDALQIKVIYWQKNWKIPGTSWTICGYSRSAYRTGFYIPELDLMLDAGPQNFNKPKSILISHSHIDHIACLPFTMIGDIHSGHVFDLYGPSKAKPYIDKYIKSMFEVNALIDIDSIPWYKYHELNPYETFRITMNKTDLEIAVFECDHAIPTISYGISEIKQKLKDEYLGLAGKEIGILRKAGIAITHEVKHKKLAYVCDTSIKVFDLNPDILNYAVVFIECTFFQTDEIENAEKTQHIHWQSLKKYVVDNPNTYFVLFHFSQRYRDVEINEFFQKEVDSGIKNIHWW